LAGAFARRGAKEVVCQLIIHKVLGCGGRCDR
jgi:hypothetical protein